MSAAPIHHFTHQPDIDAGCGQRPVSERLTHHVGLGARVYVARGKGVALVLYQHGPDPCACWFERARSLTAGTPPVTRPVSPR